MTKEAANGNVRFDTLSCRFRQHLAWLQFDDFGFHGAAIGAMEAMDCKVDVTWMSLDNGLLYRLVTLRAGVIDIQGEGHLSFLPRQAN
jgi:hypothetical protein